LYSAPNNKDKGIAPRINLSTRWKFVVSIMSWSFYSWGKSPCYQLNMSEQIKDDEMATHEKCMQNVSRKT